MEVQIMVLTYRPMKKSEKTYAIQLAWDEINIEPRRLNKYKTYLIYNDGERIGYVSLNFKSDRTIYIYILAFEKHAQRQGFAPKVVEFIIKYGGEKIDGFRGLSARIYKINKPAVNAAKKHGFIVTKESIKYFDFMKPIS